MSETILPLTADQPRLSRGWHVWGIVKLELLYLCWALMEVALFTPVILFFMRWARFWPTGQLTLWILLMMLLPFNLVRFLSALQIERRYQKRVVLLVLIITLLVAWRILLFSPRSFLDFGWLIDLFGDTSTSGGLLWARVVTLFLLILFMWWRGLSLVQFQPDIGRVGLRLRAGILLFIPFALLPQARVSAWGIMPFVLLYFVAGLMAISLIRAEQIERERSGFAASLSPGWIGAIFVTSLLVVLTAGLIAIIFSGDMLALIVQWFSPLTAALLTGTVVSISTAIYLASPLFILLEILLSWLANLFSALFSNLSEGLGLELPGIVTDFSFLWPAREEGAEIAGLSISLEATRALTMLVMLAMVVFVAFVLTRRFRQPALAPHSGGRISAAERGELPGEGIRQRLLQRLGLLRRWRTAASIRQIYRQMCVAASGVGYARGSSETPYEYLITLEQAWPDNQSDSLLVTEAYVRVRYGEIPETKEELEAIRSAWRRLEETGPEEASLSA
jgi:hypothetical protein